MKLFKLLLPIVALCFLCYSCSDNEDTNVISLETIELQEKASIEQQSDTNEYELLDFSIEREITDYIMSSPTRNPCIDEVQVALDYVNNTKCDVFDERCNYLWVYNYYVLLYYQWACNPDIFCGPCNFCPEGVETLCEFGIMTLENKIAEFEGKGWTDYLDSMNSLLDQIREKCDEC